MTIPINDAVDISLIGKLINDARRGIVRFSGTHNPLSVQSHVLLATILYQIKEIKKVDKLLYIDGGSFLVREFFLNKISHDHIKLDFPFEINIKQEADLVFGQFPFGIKFPADARISKYIPRIDSSNQMIIDSVNTISKDGMGVFLTLRYFRTFERDDLRKHLGDKGFFVNSIIKLPKDFLRPQTSIQPLLISVSRVKTDKEFILDIDSSSTYDFNLKNLFSKIDSNDISIGSWVSPDNFPGFEALERSKQLESIGGDYSDFSTLSLGQICKEINLIKTGGEFEEKEDTIYVPLIGNQEVVPNVGDLSIKHQNYAQLVVDKKKVLPKYLCSFMNSKLGIKTLELEKEFKTSFIPRLTKTQLMSLKVRVPSIDTQEEVANIVVKYKFIKDTVNKLGENITLNPLSDKDTIEAVDSILENTGKLSAIDQISSLIRNGEDKETEFKQTFCFDIRKKKRESYITDQIIKTIAAFLNSDGGNLLVGVSDSKKITGLKDEMEKFFKQGSPNPIDNIQKHLKDLIKSRIGEEFYPLIDSNLISIKSDYILRVKCEPSDKEVFVNQKEFYVRTNPATDRLEGQNLSEYIKRRFWENQ